MAKQVLIIEGWEVPHLIKYAVSYNKVWADDTGQDMSGEKKGTTGTNGSGTVLHQPLS